jgi:hypothetical protein
MKSHLEKIGVAGSVFGALALAGPCCLPLLASAGMALGLGIFAPYQGILIYLVQAFVVLSAIGAIVAYREHRQWRALALSIVSAAILLYVYNFNPETGLAYYGLAGLAIAALWNVIEGRRCATCSTRGIQMQSMLTCPHCGKQSAEIMPSDACLFFHECRHCKTMLRPKSGDCCVFCSYGSVKCPPMQQG